MTVLLVKFFTNIIGTKGLWGTQLPTFRKIKTTSKLHERIRIKIQELL